ncbi:MAG: peptidyl-prolyl cis-trans isomerase [Deltaproteobacteria bacterium]|nr:peptidyl-prolyl cis-trans isomerase [Deltaproteobacteria bacterium]
MKYIARMVRDLKLFALALMLAGCMASTENDVLYVVKVNDAVITYTQYRDALKRLIPSDRNYAPEEITELKKDLVNELVEEELILYEARRLRLKVSEEEVSAEEEVLRKDYGDETFRETIRERYGSIDKWKEEIRRKLLIQKMMERVTSGGRVTDEAALKYYKEHIRDYYRPPEVRARMIVVGSYNEARKIRKRLTPANFAVVAEEASLGPENKAGGDLGFFARGEMPKEFEAVVFRLGPGEISPVVKTDYGYHIFLVEAKRKAAKEDFALVKKKIIEHIRADEADRVFSEWIREQKKISKIEIRRELL